MRILFATTNAMHPVQRELWSRIYPNAQPAPPEQLPQCAKELKVWVYNLSAAWNSELLDTMERRRGRANCDYARSPCIET